MDAHAYSCLPVNTIFAEFITARARPASVHLVWNARLYATETVIRRGVDGGNLILLTDFIIGQLLGAVTAKCHA